MAKVTYGSLVTELTGSVGGITFQRNASGAIARLKPNRTINPSENLATRQTSLGALVAFWATLTLVQQNGWNQLAIDNPHIDPWGVAKQLNGFQQFLSNNLNLAMIEVAPIGTAPAYLLPVPPPEFSITFGASKMTLQFVTPVDPATYNLITYSTPLIRTTAINTRKAKFIIPLGTWDSSTILDITYPFCDYFSIIYADMLAENLANVVIRTKFIDPVTGFSSVYTSAIARVEPAAQSLILNFVSTEMLAAIYPDYANLAFWNTLFNLPEYGTPFTAVTELNGVVTLVGGSNITIEAGTITTSSDLLSIDDSDGCIVLIMESALDSFGGTELKLHGVTSIGMYGIQFCPNLTNLELPGCTSLTTGSISGCELLTSLNLDSLIIVPSYSIADHYALPALSLPKVTTVESSGLGGLEVLASLSLPICTSIGNDAFGAAYSLLAVNLPELLHADDGAFANLINTTSYYLPKLLTLGSTTGDNLVWEFVSAKVIELTIPAALMVCLDEGPDGDILFLDANNTLTVIQT